LALSLLSEYSLCAVDPPAFPPRCAGGSVARPRSYDFAGAVTVTAGLLLLVYAMTQAQEGGTSAVKTVGLFALALVILVCFLLNGTLPLPGEPESGARDQAS